jgi:hypothetical protein
MKDLQSQLAALQSGLPPGAPPLAPAAVPAAPLPAELDLLAHLKSPWWTALRSHRQHPDLARLGDRPSLGAATQATDRLLKSLRKEGARRDAEALESARKDFLASREKAAWAAMKEQWTRLSLSERAWRAIKQSEGDPVKLLGRLRALPESELAGMGADRLRDALLPR